MQDDNDSGFEFDSNELAVVWQSVGDVLRDYRKDLDNLPVAPRLNPNQIRSAVRLFDFELPRPWKEVLDWLDEGMRKNQLHAGHPRYFGLFNPAPVPLGIVADALTAGYNPQLAAWSHSPFANELERNLIYQFGLRFGLPEDSIDGTLCNGGAEANHTALLCALSAGYPEFATGGVRPAREQPTIYFSEFAHHSWVKAAVACGLGTAAVRRIPGDSMCRLDVASLKDVLEGDLRSGCRPLLIVGTAGTTSIGSIDPLIDLSEMARKWKCWYHVDAAWGGAARFVPEYANWLSGIENADSITFDAHKFLSIPMGAGVFITRNKQILSSTFTISTDYMPRDAASLDVIEPYAHSLQWSRRFIGLKIFLPLASAGWTGLADMIRSQCQLGERMRKVLAASGWRVLNETPLPVVCFAPDRECEGSIVEAIAKFVVESGAAWISTVKAGRPALRACITNFRSTERDVDELLKVLDKARAAVGLAR